MTLLECPGHEDQLVAYCDTTGCRNWMQLGEFFYAGWLSEFFYNGWVATGRRHYCPEHVDPKVWGLL